MPGPAADPFAALALSSPLRPYQRRALDAFEADRDAGRTETHIVAPPGSGKTVVGMEIVRRLGRPALVLAPTATIQAQWAEKLSLFGADPAATLAPAGPLHVLTYQAVCRTGDPGETLREAAEARLAEERARATAVTIAEARATADAFTGAARRRHDREVRAEVARLKKTIARGGTVDSDASAAADGDPTSTTGPAARDAEAALDALIAPEARERLRILRAAGVRTLVLDECHHLASMWGYLVRALVRSLGDDVHVVALTATSPADLRGDEADLYAGLLGPVDFEVSTPAVVRDGHLAPYQELAWFTTPLPGERAWLAERHVRFAELLDRLHEPAVAEEEDLAFGPWVIGRIRHRDTGDGTARIPFSTLAARRPDLARAGLRYLASSGLELPDDAPRGEGWREPPTLDDWLVLIGDYAVGCLRAHPGDAAERRLDELGVGLRDLGFGLTRGGVRRAASDVDRVLLQSAAKPLAAIEVLGVEAETRGDALRAAVLCDTEHPPSSGEDAALALSGGARAVLRTFADDVRTAALRPLLVTGRTVACLPDDAERFAAALGATERREEDGLVVLGAPGWDSRAWVAAAGRALADGTTQCLIGTRGLLGEGWDAPVLNVLLDLTSVAADVSVRQMRGRTLRLDPADDGKISSNWDVVCIAADLARGTADHDRFVRRHAHLRAPCEDGSIESGVSHVHPTLSPYLPPADEDHAALNASAAARTADHHAARERWRVGEPYVGEDVPVLLVGAAAGRTGAGATRLLEPGAAGPGSSVGGASGAGARLGGGVGTAGAPRGSTGAVRPSTAVGRPLGAEALLPDATPDGPPPRITRSRSLFLAGSLRTAYPAVLPLDRVARAVVDAYRELGELSPTAADSLVIAPRPGGLVRCALAAGDADENRRFADALDEALSPAAGQRWVLGRPVWPPDRRRRSVAWRALTGRPPLEVAWHAVPSDLGTHKDRATVYHRSWEAHVGPGELRFAGRTGATGRDALTAAASADAAYVTSRRTLWH
ncbi:DEAD/DEAH box helicase family protein [Patulibacter minatonensis]|uniref:DEAD/DEAH box helicase family protein n=1 Tax=Patulibacter minatonensis TaxID=298163 RepID=UPI00047DA35F|nr:DEAD/DEAH box helicase family protein [Patulibacter minatonensis]